MHFTFFREAFERVARYSGGEGSSSSKTVVEVKGSSSVRVPSCRGKKKLLYRFLYLLLLDEARQIRMVGIELTLRNMLRYYIKDAAIGSHPPLHFTLIHASLSEHTLDKPCWIEEPEVMTFLLSSERRALSAGCYVRGQPLKQQRRDRLFATCAC